MCYLLREPSASPEPGRAGSPSAQPLPRQRWILGAAALVGSIAMAALVSPARAPEVQRQAGPIVPVAAKATAEPTAGALQRTALPADDDVPTANGASGARMGHCHEGL